MASRQALSAQSCGIEPAPLDAATWKLVRIKASDQTFSAGGPSEAAS